MKQNNANEKATVCSGKTCVTVHGETAQLVNAVVLIAVALMLVGVVSKAIR